MKSCPPILVAVSGEATPLGSSAECVSSTNTTGNTTGATTERICATEIEDDFTAILTTLATAKSASDTAAILNSEADEIEEHVATTETLLKDYSDEAKGLLITLTSILEAGDFSPAEKESANQQLQVLVNAVDIEATAAISDKTKAEVNKASAAESSAESESFNQKAIASDAYIQRLETDIARLEKILEEEGDNGGLTISEQLRFLIDFRDNEVFFLQDHARDAGVNARKARSTVRDSRELYTASIERRVRGQSKLQESKDFFDSLGR